MKCTLPRQRVWFWYLWCLVVTCASAVNGAPAGEEETFDRLTVGNRTFTNATVTTRAKDYVFISHAGGLANIKVAEMSPDLREKLGYQREPATRLGTNGIPAWAKARLPKVEVAQVKDLEQILRAYLPASLQDPAVLTPKRIMIGLAVLAALYLFFCHCCQLICEKAGQEPSVLIWVPLLQLFPLLRAAGMSPMWFFAWLVPGLNIVAQIVWSVKIVQARSKGPGIALLLLVPGINLLAFLYLAFSGRPTPKPARRPQAMALEPI